MTFVSYVFVAFFVSTLIVYYSVPWNNRRHVLLIASMIFYGYWSIKYLFLMLFITLVSYASGYVGGGGRSKKTRLFAFLVGIAANLGVLFYFKYSEFFLNEIAMPLGLVGNGSRISLGLLLPLGISFHTFVCMSYVIDAYRRIRPVESNVSAFTAYSFFFPQMVAGPIERSTHLLPQIKQLYDEKCRSWPRFDYARVTDGLRLMLWGYLKKIVVADNLALFLDPVFKDPAGFSSLDCVIASFMFSLQILYDFSAYTDIARGAAKTLGFDLLENFNAPYFSRSIPEFWRRWHISLTTWFRLYVYYPMGGNRVSRWRWVFNILAVFLLSGFWHGAYWTFVAWGACHGLLYLLSLALEPRLKPLADRTLGRVPGLLPTAQVALTFTLVTLAWVLFRAETFPLAMGIFEQWWHLIRSVLVLDRNAIATAVHNSSIVAMMLRYPFLFVVMGALIVIGESAQSLVRPREIGEFIGKWSTASRWAFYFGSSALIIFCGALASRQFIYFQF